LISLFRNEQIETEVGADQSHQKFYSQILMIKKLKFYKQLTQMCQRNKTKKKATINQQQQTTTTNRSIYKPTNLNIVELETVRYESNEKNLISTYEEVWKKRRGGAGTRRALFSSYYFDVCEAVTSQSIAATIHREKGI